MSASGPSGPLVFLVNQCFVCIMRQQVPPQNSILKTVCFSRPLHIFANFIHFLNIETYNRTLIFKQSDLDHHCLPTDQTVI